MESNNKQTLLKAKGASYKTVDGVTYFKLKSEIDGDYTKNCGLLGEEIDENFYFLRGYDIETMYVDENRNLIINRVDKDYEPIKVKIGEDLGKDLFEFNKDTGTIIITYPDKTTAKLDGFLVEGKDIRIATDNTLQGDGTIFSPLKVSIVERTGTYAPADDYFDLTNPGPSNHEKLEDITKGKNKGYRFVSKEKIDNFGCLYPLKTVNTIQAALTKAQSQWRVPTKQDWDELLNAMEVNEKAKNHDSYNNKWLGEVAGSALKSINLWKKYDNLPSEISTMGEDAVGISILPLGIGPDRNEILNDENSDIEGFTKLAGMWTNTMDETGNAYVKIFGYNSAQVDQDTYGNGARMSIRLVKDYAYSNYNEIETILGLPYPTVLVESKCDEIKYIKIWTKINVYDSSKALGGVRSKEWDIVSDSDKGVTIVYFINEWDGSKWHKRALKEGDSIVIKKYINKPYHEWRIINSELIDTLDHVMDAFDETLNNLNNRLDAHENAIKEEIKIREENILELNKKIDSEVNKLQNSDAKLKEALDLEHQNRVKEINRLDNSINSEALLREKQDNILNEKISKEIIDRENATNELRTALDIEIEHRKIEDEKIHNLINIERDERKLADEKETNERIEADIIERQTRIDNDITPGKYILNGANDKKMILPTNGENVDDIEIKLSDDFFNFGPILNE